MTVTAQSISPPRFVRKTSLQAHERNTNFIMLDNEIMAAITSEVADRVTPLMSKIYLRLRTAPRETFEREGVLRFAGEERKGKWVTAWEQLRQYLRVSSETANKALSWMHNEGIIGYSAYKNGVGIRIFLNRAASSIGFRPVGGDQKILRFPRTSVGVSRASESETPFKVKDSENNLDKDNKSLAPKDGAETKSVSKKSSYSPLHTEDQLRLRIRHEGREVATAARHPDAISLEEIIALLRSELEPCVKGAAQAASRTAAQEMARTREWFETKALPKAVRVAQHEVYDLLRKQGALDERTKRARADLEVGRLTSDSAPVVVKPLSPTEILETAETCVALLEAQGKPIEMTLTEISSEGGGWVLPEDAPKVRKGVYALLSAQKERSEVL